MTRTTMRWTMAGALALAAVGVLGGALPATATAEAAPAVSPFAGVYVGVVPQPSNEFTWTIAISDGGSVKGAYFSGTSKYYYRGSLSGTVSDSGALSIKGADVVHVLDWNGELVRYRGSFAITTTVAVDANGDLTVGQPGGETVTWFRQ